MTTLRRLKMDRLPSDEIYVFQDHGEPIAVLVPYTLFCAMEKACHVQA